MKVIYNNIIPFKGFSAMMFFGIIFARKSSKPLSQITINHESIHKAQANDCHGFIMYYLKYICQWIKYGYKNCPFEREAYNNQNDFTYLNNRSKKAWKEYSK